MAKPEMMRCPICRRGITYPLGLLSEALTKHYRRAHPEAPVPPSR